MYVKIKDGSISKVVTRLPKWFDTKGNPLTPEWFKEHENIYPLLEETVVYDSFYQYASAKPMNEWVVEFQSLTEEQIEKDITPKVIKVTRTYNVVDNSISSVITEKKSKLRELRDLHERSGYKKTLATGKTVRVHSDKTSQFNILTIRSLSTEGCENFKTMDGYTPLTQLELQELVGGLFIYVQACYNNEKRVIELLDKCKTIPALKTATAEIEKGWPEGSVYSESLEVI